MYSGYLLGTMDNASSASAALGSPASTASVWPWLLGAAVLVGGVLVLQPRSGSFENPVRSDATFGVALYGPWMRVDVDAPADWTQEDIDAVQYAALATARAATTRSVQTRGSWIRLPMDEADRVMDAVVDFLVTKRSFRLKHTWTNIADLDELTVVDAATGNERAASLFEAMDEFDAEAGNRS